MSVNLVWLFGNSIVRTTGVPSLRSRGVPSASAIGTWQPSQLACWLPLAKEAALDQRVDNGFRQFPAAIDLRRGRGERRRDLRDARQIVGAGGRGRFLAAGCPSDRGHRHSSLPYPPAAALHRGTGGAVKATAKAGSRSFRAPAEQSRQKISAKPSVFPNV